MPKSEICAHDLCTGCAACVNICPRNAISMSEDETGYSHPVIRLEDCIDCGLCEKVCPVLHPVELHQPLSTFALVSNDTKERQTSSSGGAASVVARQIIGQGGVVYGCSQKDYRTIRHIRADNNEDIDLLKGSKYVQSDINLIYREIKTDLQQGRKVLFVGTPCQVAGLKNFLRKDFENLYTADLICHGVPSQKMLRDDIQQQGRGCENAYVSFRWKTSYGIQFGIQLKSATDNKLLYSKPLPYDPYILAFFTGISFRENCHVCPYSQSSRVGDITIGDFWKLGAHKKSQFKIKDGVSLVLVNTDKGKHLLSELRDKFIIEEHTLEEAVAGNFNLHTASPRPANKDLFMSIYRKGGLSQASKTAISKKQYYKLVAIESIKRHKWLVSLFKKIRLMLNKITR